MTTLGIPEAARTAWAALADALDREPPAPCTGRAEWTNESASDRLYAAGHCARCPVLAACSTYAEAANERHGVWAGVDRTAAPARPATHSIRSAGVPGVPGCAEPPRHTGGGQSTLEINPLTGPTDPDPREGGRGSVGDWPPGSVGGQWGPVEEKGETDPRNSTSSTTTPRDSPPGHHALWAAHRRPTLAPPHRGAPHMSTVKNDARTDVVRAVRAQLAADEQTVADIAASTPDPAEFARAAIAFGAAFAGTLAALTAKPIEQILDRLALASFGDQLAGDEL